MTASLIILLFLLLSPFVVNVGEAKVELRIRPTGVGPGEQYFVVGEGARLELTCELRTAGGAHVAEGLDWMRGALRVEPTWLSMFTQPADSESGWAGHTLVVPRVDAQSAGDYRCAYFDEVAKRAHVHVLENINWRTKGDSVGGPIGQPLTIDCGAGDLPNSMIKILDHAGAAIEQSANLSAPLYVAGAELTIPILGAEHQGMKVRCVAIRTVVLAEGVATIHTDEHLLTVDVWEPPRFAALANGGRFYALPGAAVVLRWSVRASRPPVLNFTLKKDNERIGADDADGAATHRRRYTLRTEGGRMATLSISDVQDEDYGRYTLIAHNGKLFGHQVAQLDMPKPPKQPRVWPEAVSNASVSWRVREQPAEGQLLPVSFFIITYRPLRRRVAANATSPTAGWSLLESDDFSVERQKQKQHNPTRGNNKQHDGDDDNNMATGDGWETVATNTTNTMRRQKSPTDVYDIAGLAAHTEYEFTFQAGNAEGQSDPLTLKQETVDNWEPSSGSSDADGVAHRSDHHAASSASSSAGRLSVRFVVTVVLAVLVVLFLAGLAAVCCSIRSKPAGEAV